MRYALTEAVKIEGVVYPVGMECTVVESKHIPTKYPVLCRFAAKIDAGKDTNNLVVILDGEFRLIKRCYVEPK